MNDTNRRIPRVVIVGGGFGGLSAAKALRKAPVEVVLIDRRNYHLFQPLLYQVAISVLAPSQIAAPIREIVSDQKNTIVEMGEVVGVNKEEKRVFISNVDRHEVPLDYDYLILATGATHSYFGHDEFEKYAPGLKGLGDAVAIRNKILEAFEQAEAEEDTRAHQELLTFVLVGGGPAGVEMAGAIAELVRRSLPTQFRRIDPTSARIVLVDRSKKLLNAYADDLSNAAKNRLEELGIEVILGKSVDQIDENGVIVSGQRIPAKTVVWTAGVAPSRAGKWLNVETDKAGRVRIQQDLTIPGHPEIFVIGDTMTLEQDGQPLGGVAQVAIQQGHYAGKAILRKTTGKPAPPPFRYFDKGTMAVVGGGYAILQSGKLHLKSWPGWLAWGMVHVLSLGTVGLTISVFLQWMWLLLTGQQGARLIIDYERSEAQNPVAEAAVRAAASGK